MSIINDYGWQVAATTQQRSSVSTDSDAVPYVPVSVAIQSTSDTRGSTSHSEQRFHDNQQEAFAKFKVSLQNLEEIFDTKESESTALQEFRDYMALSPEQKIREKMLRELGLSLEEYEELPPEKKELIDKQIAQRIKEEMEIKTMAKLQPPQQMDAVNALAGSQTLSAEGTDEKDRTDPLA